MASEQLRAERLFASADLYALGCILYELLDGDPGRPNRPFRRGRPGAGRVRTAGWR
ncbi:hypothetical protein ACPCIX_05130 [Streptomyces pseudogriseolus]|uniref:hypothetical protein n=1 Tax=Streptomyces pseudogriseolus TaxID=36817 RepID=UPI00346D1D25